MMKRTSDRRKLLLKLAWLPAALPLVAAVCELDAQVGATTAKRQEAAIQAAAPQPPAGSIIFNDPSPAPSHRDLSKAIYVGVKVCAECHDQLSSDRPHHSVVQEWEDPTNNAHANDASMLDDGRTNAYTSLVTGGVPVNGVKSCGVCHTTGAPNFNQPQVAQQGGYDPSLLWNGPHNVNFLRVQCEACHGPGSLHVSSKGDRRWINRVPDPKQTCWNCHVHTPREKGNILAAPATDVQIALYSSESLGDSMNPGALIAGTGGYEYAGEDYTQGHTQPHTRIAATCVTCHTYRDPRSPILDHSSLDAKVAACRSCHMDANRVDSLDDWSYLQGRQRSIQQLLIQLGGADDTGAPDPDAGGGLLGNAADKDSAEYRRARWNYSLVLNDGSEGAHNYDYALELLLTSITHAPAQSLPAKR